LCWWPGVTPGQVVPYARSYAKPKEEVERALRELQAYSGQKLPILEGFVAKGAKPLDRYERGFYQFNIELLPGDAGATVVRLSAKITAWYADSDPAKSRYEVLSSNGRVELDFLDRLEEKLTGKSLSSSSSSNSSVQAPRPKLDLSGVPGAQAAAIIASPLPETARSPDEIAKLRVQRETAEKQLQQLTAELQSLQEIQRNQAHPQNLVIVKKSGTPVYAKGAENARVLFQAAENDEFEFLDEERVWIHVTISGDSRGYIQRDALELPEKLAERLRVSSAGPEVKFAGFRIEREEISIFPGDWAQLRGKKTKLYTVQIVSQDAKESGPAVRLNYTLTLFEKGLKETAGSVSPPDGVVVIFDSADGGIAAATIPDIQKVASGAIMRDAFWSQCHLDPPEAFRPSAKP
jgi:hypothetical protein